MRSFSNTALLAAFAASVSACAGEVGEEGGEERESAAPTRYSKSTKILVVGAGPSGLTTALKLGDLGYQNVSIWERELTIGGKVQTVNLKDLGIDLSAELGAVFVSDDYTLVRDELAINRFGYTMEGKDPPNAEGTWDIRRYSTPRYIWEGGPAALGGKAYDFEAFLEQLEPNDPFIADTGDMDGDGDTSEAKPVLTLAERQANPGAMRREHAKTAYAKFLATQAASYNSPRLDNLDPGMSADILTYAANYDGGVPGTTADNLTSVVEVARSIQVGFGYGFYETAPAAYFIKLLPWIVKLVPDASFPSGYRLNNPEYYVFNDGFQQVWNRVADAVRAKQGSDSIKTLREVAKVEPCGFVLLQPGCNGRKYRVWYKNYVPVDILIELVPGLGPFNGASLPGWSDTFDQVVFSTAPQTTQWLIADSSTESKAAKAIFAKAKSIQYFLTIFLSSSLQAGRTLFVHDTSQASLANHVHVLGSRSADQQLFLTYQVGDGTRSYWDVHQIMKNDLQTIWGGKMDLGVWKPWPVYFPYLKTADFGSYVTLENNQGKNGLYFTGGFMNMETTEHAARHAADLVARKFGPAL